MNPRPIILANSKWPDPAFHAGFAEVAVREDWQVIFTAHRGGRYYWEQVDRYDGVLGIFNAFDPELFPQINAWRAPVVNLSPAQPSGLQVPVANVCSDGVAIGRIGARHLIQEGHRHLGFLVHSGMIYETERYQGFQAEAARHGIPCQRIRAHLNRHDPNTIRALHGLPKPTAIMCENDDIAVFLCAICRHLGLAIPEDIAVLGVDDDPLLCLQLRPQLASVQTDLRGVAVRAAETLALMLAGREVPPLTRLPPYGVAARASADFRLVDHRSVLQALGFIGQHFSRPITAVEVVRHVDQSRSALYRAFAKHRQRTVAEEILHQRLEAATTMLTSTRRTLADIAAACGFASTAVFIRAFKRRHGQTPGSYRRHAHRD